MHPSISIITISFNQLQYLKLAVASIHSQKYPRVEHVVVDPGSTDGSREWLKSVDQANLKLHFEPDHGPADGLNRGLELSTGDIVIYLNSDDELAPGALRSIAAAHTAAPGADVIIGNGWLIDENSRPLKYVRSDRFSPRRYCMAVGTVLQQSTTFKASVFERGLRFNADNRINWDTELVFDCYKRQLIIDRSPEDWGYFRLQPDSITVSGRYAELYRGEEARLRRSQVGPLFYALSTILRLPARAVKFARARVLNAVRTPVFPGLSR